MTEFISNRSKNIWVSQMNRIDKLKKLAGRGKSVEILLQKGDPGEKGEAGEVDYSHIEGFIERKVAEIPKPKDAEIDYKLIQDIIKREVKQLPNPKIEVDYVRIKTIIDNQIKQIPIPKDGEPGRGVVWRDQWTGSTTYRVNEAVFNTGSAYICIKEHQSGNSNEPPIGSAWKQYWAVMAEKGEAGQGGRGADGAPGVGVPVGGTTNQVLAKNSNTDYDTKWVASGGGSSTWGGITGTLSDQTDLQTALNAKQALDSDLTAIAALDSSTSGAIASDGAGWIKKTYAQFKTALGLVKGDVGLGNVVNADTTTTANITDSTNKRFITDAQQTVLGNTSGTNTGDQTSVSGNAGTATALQTARNIDGVSFNGTADITVIAPGTHAATSKATPVDADEISLVDSAASNVLKKLTWANLKAAVKTYYDPVASTFTNKTFDTAGSGNSLSINGVAATDNTGTGKVVRDTSPTISGAGLGSSTATTQTPADNSTKLATTAYVDNAVLGQRLKEAVKYASIAALPSIIYANGSSGVGATLTGVALAAISLDSSSPAVNDRVLIKDQASTLQNGIYKVTATGSGIAVFVLTRVTDFDQAADIQTGDSVFVTAGSTLANTTWAYNAADNPVMGTDPITFVQSAGPGVNTAGNGITITGASIAINTTVTVDKTTAQALTNKDLSGAGNTFPTFNQNTSGTASNLSGTPALPNGTTATTQSASDGSTKIATTAYVDAADALKLNRKLSIVAKSTTYTATTSDDVITVTAASSWTLALFTAVGNAGRVLYIKKTDADSTANFVTIDPNSTETIDGLTTYPMYTQNEVVAIVSDGTNWQII